MGGSPLSITKETLEVSPKRRVKILILQTWKPRKTHMPMVPCRVAITCVSQKRRKRNLETTPVKGAHKLLEIFSMWQDLSYKWCTNERLGSNLAH